ncbi:MAG TPA: response regulator [Planctomycetota bacterium]|nr:response regulator [Planctomycetota bacterium]
MPGPQEPPRILIGDDEFQICRLLQDVLSSVGYLIDVTQTGREFLDKYRSGAYSLLILDTVLLHTSGLEVVMKLRDRGDGIPIILMSGPSREADRVEPFAFTYRVDVLRKPFGVGDLRSAVGRALGSGRPD